jgi:hypothetical protein
MKMDMKPTMTVDEIVEETKRNFIAMNGRLLTEKEAVEFTDKIRKELREEEEGIGNGNDDVG